MAAQSSAMLNAALAYAGRGMTLRELVPEVLQQHPWTTEAPGVTRGKVAAAR